MGAGWQDACGSQYRPKGRTKAEAAAIGADAIIAVRLYYSEVSAGGSGGGILFVAASGTAVKLTG
ncbi:heavy metal-binding domain-containing protein [Sinorhizobium garamanticum]|uniref:Heavy metal-binding domain-containing protein n=1 Tax=Sinorhizobium garamanticum TaxID=680247 RepID=A0ABY8DM39_9HYPH|nr:heavy metal-binding domain-containing protein [Sinorhizobium garamanticum]WEX91283.1 heavy metal-binding domain-containing protein [Sinorhizobium garamanticum]